VFRNAVKQMVTTNDSSTRLSVLAMETRCVHCDTGCESLYIHR